MPNKIAPRRSFTPNSVPIPSTDISQAGELLVNWADGKFFTKDASGNLVTINAGGGSGGGGGSSGSGSTSIVYAATPSAFPATGSSTNLYVTDARRIYGWDSTNSVYVELGPVGGSGINWATVPASATAAGSPGDLAYDGNYVYVATGSSQWKRAALSTWTTFTPATVAGLQLWLDASDSSSLYDATSGGSLVATDGAVARWQDKSGNSRHFTQSDSSRRPLRKASTANGRDVLRFDGSNDFLEGGDYLDLDNGTSMTVFAVVKRNSTGTSDNIIYKYGLLSTPGTDQGWGIGWNADNTVTTYIILSGSNYTGLQSNAAVTASAYSVLAFKTVGGSATTATVQYKNGSVVASTMTASPAEHAGNTPFPVRIGAAEYNGSYSGLLDGDVGEVCIYNSALGDTDRAAVESYLMSKWGIV